MAANPTEDVLLIRRPHRDYLGVREDRRMLAKAARDAEGMPTRKLEKRCARTASKAGKFLASARAIIEPELPYFLELRWRLNAQGQRGGVEGWQRWCEKHFSCDVRTVNRALSATLGPQRERKKSRSWRAPAEALIAATEPAIRLARKYPKDPDAGEFLSSLETEELSGFVHDPLPRPENIFDKLLRERGIKTEELYKMGLHLAHAVVDGSSSVRGDTPEGKKILGLATHMLEIENKGEKPQDNLPRSPVPKPGLPENLDCCSESSSARSLSMSSPKTWFGCGRFHGMAASKRTNTAKTAKSNHHDMSASHFEVSSPVLQGDYRESPSDSRHHRGRRVWYNEL
jgi:hypothetical protein